VEKFSTFGKNMSLINNSGVVIKGTKVRYISVLEHTFSNLCDF
jgi:hypothetical protein